MLSIITEIGSFTTSGTTSGTITPDQTGGAIDDDWFVIFSGATAGNIYGGTTGSVHAFTDLTSAKAPDNSGKPYFTIPGSYFTGTWAIGEIYHIKSTAKTTDIEMLVPNRYHYQSLLGAMNTDADDYRAILVDAALGAFDIDTHGTYTGDIVTNELVTGNGYTVGGFLLQKSGVTVEDDTNDSAHQDFNDLTIDAVDAGLTFDKVIIYNDTIGENTICGCYQLDAPLSITAGSSYIIRGLAVGQKAA